MANHFLKTKAARELPLAKILRMHEDTAYGWFCRGRWPDTDGQPDGCPRCPSTKRPFAIRRRAFKCRDCRREFSVTSGTPFASHKLSFRNMLALVAMARDGVKGRAALEVFRILGLDYKSAWVNLMKVREALCLAQDAEPQLEGVVEMDALHISGHVRPINDRERDPPLHRVEHGRMARRAVLGMREMGGRVRVVATIGETAPAVTMAAQRYISPNALVITDEAAAYDILPALFQHTARVNIHGQRGCRRRFGQSAVRRHFPGLSDRSASVMVVRSMSKCLLDARLTSPDL